MADVFAGESREWLPAYTITLLVITTLLLFARLGTRWRLVGIQLGLDDALIFTAWLFAIPMGVLIILQSTMNKIGRHVWDIPVDYWSRLAFWSLIIEILFVISTACTKLSILLFYRRLVKGTCGRTFKWAIWAGMGFVVAYSITIVIVFLTHCKPLDAEWKRWGIYEPDQYQCRSVHDRVASAYVAGAFSVFSDWYSVLLPSLLLSRLNICRRQRIALMCVFGLGYLAIGAGIARMVFHSRVEAVPLDKVWQAFGAYVATILECLIGIICACAPSLKSLFGRFFRDTSTQNSSSRRTPFGTIGSGIKRGADAIGLSTMLRSTRNSAVLSNSRHLSRLGAERLEDIDDVEEAYGDGKGPIVNDKIYEVTSDSGESASTQQRVDSPPPHKASPQWNITKTLDITVTESHADAHFSPPTIGQTWARSSPRCQGCEAYAGDEHHPPPAANPSRSRDSSVLPPPVPQLGGFTTGEGGGREPRSLLSVEIPTSSMQADPFASPTGTGTYSKPSTADSAATRVGGEDPGKK